MGEKGIDKSEWKTKDPKLFEYDKNNNIVDIFVKADLTCPFPFHKDDWYHQGFYLQSFITYLKLFLEKHNLPYEVILKSELEDLKLFTTPPSLTQKEIDMIRGYGEED